MKELDVLLERFAREALPAAGGEERAVFAEILALPDPELSDCLLGGASPADPRLACLMGRIRDLCRPEEPVAVFCRDRNGF
jgi:succinate dehydrogenase flavin-adding protein (antitoxin of CptAB toxin-antitoxin module)